MRRLEEETRKEKSHVVTSALSNPFKSQKERNECVREGVSSVFFGCLGDKTKPELIFVIQFEEFRKNFNTQTRTHKIEMKFIPK
jgi:hypothetical protein